MTKIAFQVFLETFNLLLGEIVAQNSVESNIKSYLEALKKAAYPEILDFFTEDALVVSPFYGRIQASQFFRELFDDTEESKISLLNILISPNNSQVGAAHVYYEWILKDKTVTTFEGILLFHYDESSGKIWQLTIIYDTSKAASHL